MVSVRAEQPDGISPAAPSRFSGRLLGLELPLVDHEILQLLENESLAGPA